MELELAVTLFTVASCIIFVMSEIERRKINRYLKEFKEKADHLQSLRRAHIEYNESTVSVSQPADITKPNPFKSLPPPEFVKVPKGTPIAINYRIIVDTPAASHGTQTVSPPVSPGAHNPFLDLKPTAPPKE